MVRCTASPQPVSHAAGQLHRIFHSQVARQTSLARRCADSLSRGTFVRTSRTPTACITARTAPPAITPVPSEAGFTMTRPAPYSPISWCGRVLLISGTRISSSCGSTPFLIASGTHALCQYQNRRVHLHHQPQPARQKTSSSALNHLGDAIDRNDLILQIQPLCGNTLLGLSHNYSLLFFAASSSTFFRFFGAASPSASSGRRPLRSCSSPPLAASVKALTSAVIEITTAVKHNLLDTFLKSTLSDYFANALAAFECCHRCATQILLGG